MPVMVAMHQGKMVWQVPAKEIRIYVPPRHPILDRADNKLLVWTVLE